MVRHEIVPDREDVIVRIYDAPAKGWRTIFVEKGGFIVRYQKYDEARTGVEIYERANKIAFFEAEVEVYLEAAATGNPLDACGLPALVCLGEPGHRVYATFILSEEFIRQSTQQIIGYKGDDPIYSKGWAACTASPAR
jgi:hypothetical protein